MKLLLVDDDENERTLLRDILRAQGSWVITEAASGREAHDLLLGGLEPAVSIFDIEMPMMNGIQLLERVRQEQALRHLKVVMSSSSRDRETILAMTKLGVSGYLLKPYEQAKTGASLRQILGAAHVTIPSNARRNLLQKTALVVDDDPMFRVTLRDLLHQDSGWEVVEADDGLHALELLREGLRPDIGIFDLKMPRLDGHHLLARIREDPQLRSLPVVVVSGTQDREKIVALAQLRISGYLLKPLDLKKANAAIATAMKAVAA